MTVSDRELTWKVLDSKEDRDYRLFSVHIHQSKSPRTGDIHNFQVLSSPDWVTVIPVTADNKLVFVNQYRHGSGTLSLEPPGGLVKKGQTPEQSAREELEEETGYLADTFELLGWMHPLPALFDNKLHVFYAKNAEPTGRIHPDETEEIQTVLIPVNDLPSYIRTGKINCGIMIAALHLFLNRRLT
jgi:8-oxo-dGTP pyrophosphatase MutT (NUDIX family)